MSSAQASAQKHGPPFVPPGLGVATALHSYESLDVSLSFTGTLIPGDISVECPVLKLCFLDSFRVPLFPSGTLTGSIKFCSVFFGAHLFPHIR